MYIYIKIFHEGTRLSLHPTDSPENEEDNASKNSNEGHPDVYIYICKELLVLTLDIASSAPGQLQPPRQLLWNSRYIVILFVLLLTVVPAYAVGD